MKHPFVVGAAVGVGGFLVWRNRGWFIALFRRLRHPLSGFGDERTAALLPGGAGVAVAFRQMRRYAFAAAQDRSPTVGITHASYALNSLELLEEVLGRATLEQVTGCNVAMMRTLITQLQDQHAKQLQACDPFLTAALALERQGGPSAFADSLVAPAGA